MTWSAADESKLREAERLVQDSKTRRDEARERVRKALTPAGGQGPIGDNALDQAIRNADEVRDALAAFDSGIRPPKVAPVLVTDGNGRSFSVSSPEKYSTLGGGDA